MPLSTVLNKKLDNPESDNEFLKIYREDIPLADKITSTFMLAFKKIDVFSYRRLPIPPTGFEKDFESYNKLPYEKKSEGWMILKSKYSGYFKSKEEIEANNKSNQYFLNEMQKHFHEIGMLSASDKCRLMLNEFEIESKMPY